MAINIRTICHLNDHNHDAKCYLIQLNDSRRFIGVDKQSMRSHHPHHKYQLQSYLLEKIKTPPPNWCHPIINNIHPTAMFMVQKFICFFRNGPPKDKKFN